MLLLGLALGFLRRVRALKEALVKLSQLLLFEHCVMVVFLHVVSHLDLLICNVSFQSGALFDELLLLQFKLVAPLLQWLSDSIKVSMKLLILTDFVVLKTVEVPLLL